MATVLDIGLLNYFSVIYPVLLIFALTFAILQKTKVLGDSMGINAVVAVVVAFMSLLSKTITDIISFIVPWFVVVIIFFVLIILSFMTFGAKEGDIASALKDKTLQWAIIGIGIIIIIAALGKVAGQSLTEASFQGVNTVNATNITGGGVATPSFEQNIQATLFHPKVLGLIILFAVAIFAVAFLSGNAA